MKRLIEWVKEMCIKYRELILYLICGVIVTIVNFVAYWICYTLCGIPNLISNAIAWVLAVLVAYVSNKIWVFESKSWELSLVLSEAGKFIGGRAITGLLEEVMMGIGVDILGFDGMLIKIISSIIVVVLNYVLSKLIIFRKNKE